MKSLKDMVTHSLHGNNGEKPCWKCRNSKWIALVPQTSLAEFTMWIETGGYEVKKCRECNYTKIGVKND